MKKAASAFLRMEICHADITRMIRWMRNPNVTKYLNEAPDVAQSLEQLVRSVPEPMYQYHLSRTGHFFMVCHQENESVGFVKLLPTAMEGAYEIVYVIGEDALWGHGLGQQAVRSALSKAFLHLRADRVVAKVMPQNLRSIRCVRACGFQQMAEMPRLVRFEITFDAYCQANRCEKSGHEAKCPRPVMTNCKFFRRKRKKAGTGGVTSNSTGTNSNRANFGGRGLVCGGCIRASRRARGAVEVHRHSPELESVGVGYVLGVRRAFQRKHRGIVRKSAVRS